MPTRYRLLCSIDIFYIQHCVHFHHSKRVRCLLVYLSDSKGPEIKLRPSNENDCQIVVVVGVFFRHFCDGPRGTELNNKYDGGPRVKIVSRKIET